MSLINDMLQDLDSRKQGENGDRVCEENVAVPLTDNGKPRIVWMFFGLALAAAIGYWLAQPLVTSFWHSKSAMPEELVRAIVDKDQHIGMNPPVEVLAVPVAATGTAGVTITENTEENINNTPVEVIEEKIVVIETDTPKTQIETLLSKAEIALNNNRLSLPRGQSAYDLYRQIIAIDATNAPALAGMEKITDRYIALIEDALAASESERAAQLVRRVEKLSLTFDASQLDGYRDKIQKQQLAAQNSPQESDVSESISIDNQNSADTYIAINKTTVSRELALAQQTQQLFAQGRGREAAVQLQNFIANNPTADLSRILLFDYYLGQTQITKAREVMEPGYATDTASLAYMQARMSLMSSGPAAAITLLENHKPGKNIAETYNTLLAGLYQKEKSHDKAVALYASLIEINPSNVTYWLGMGVSRDALGQLQLALNAYNVVLAHKNLDGNVRNFVKTRIQALSSQELAEAAW